MQDVRDEGLSTSAATDARLKKLIKRASKKIDLFTGQWFMPIKAVVELNGRGGSIIYTPSLIPIAKVYSIKIIPERSLPSRNIAFFDTVSYTLSETEYAFSSDRRYIQLVSGSLSDFVFGSYKRIFPKGVRNVQVDGAFGWLENLKEFETEVSANASPGDTTIQLADVSGISIDDVLYISIGNNFTTLIVQDIVGSSVIVDPLDSAVSFGDKVYVYGKVPDMIRYCAIKLSILFSQKIGDVYLGTQKPAILANMITEEKMDEYRYRIDGSVASLYGGGYVLGSTGDGEVDRILSEFTKPPEVEIV